MRWKTEKNDRGLYEVTDSRARTVFVSKSESAALHAERHANGDVSRRDCAECRQARGARN